MGRKATKAKGNIWYQARMEAANWNPKLSSREGAAELANMSVDAINNTERGLEKCMPVEKAVILADIYNAPNLLNYYCINECPIGRNKPLSSEVIGIDRATVKLFKALRIDQLEDIKNKLLDIAEDGCVTDDELDGFAEVMDYVDELSKTLSEIRLLGEKIIKRR